MKKKQLEHKKNSTTSSEYQGSHVIEVRARVDEEKTT